MSAWFRIVEDESLGWRLEIDADPDWQTMSLGNDGTIMTFSVTLTPEQRDEAIIYVRRLRLARMGLTEPIWLVIDGLDGVPVAYWADEDGARGDAKARNAEFARQIESGEWANKGAAYFERFGVQQEELQHP